MKLTEISVSSLRAAMISNQHPGNPLRMIKLVVRILGTNGLNGLELQQPSGTHSMIYEIKRCYVLNNKADGRLDPEMCFKRAHSLEIATIDAEDSSTVLTNWGKEVYHSHHVF
jgi:hypothetical protein